ncbi:MAG: hypothetical protein CVV27_18575, partial [Candidatus Melainabacteria bacterium HGW-Melainabacteria-1]
FGLDARSDALGADSLISRLELKQGDAALNLSVGQQFPVAGEAFDTYAAQLRLGGKGSLSGFVGGELKQIGQENIKAGLSYSAGRTRISTEAVSLGKSRDFDTPVLSHHLAYQLSNGWDLKLGAKPQAEPNQQKFSIGLQGKF